MTLYVSNIFPFFEHCEKGQYSRAAFVHIVRTYLYETVLSRGFTRQVCLLAHYFFILGTFFLSKSIVARQVVYLFVTFKSYVFPVLPYTKGRRRNSLNPSWLAGELYSTLIYKSLFKPLPSFFAAAHLLSRCVKQRFLLFFSSLEILGMRNKGGRVSWV